MAMTIHDRHDLATWLAAERAGQYEEADRRFRPVAGRLTRWTPSPAFAAAVLARLDRFAAPVPDMWSAWWVRAAIGASMATAGIVLGSWSLRSVFMAGLASLHTALWAADSVLVAAGTSLTMALSAWSTVTHVAIVMGRLAAQPGPLVWLAVNLAIAAVALTALHRLLVMQEN